MVFEGVCTALVTPFNKNRQVDYVALKRLLETQVKAGIGAICILGSTGESATISEQEREKIISFSRECLPPWCRLIVGTGSNDTQHAIKLCRQAERLKADACLVCTPYYNKCTQNGLFLHFKAVSESTNLPIIVYNVPSRTGVNIQPKTMKKIAGLKNVAGLKEANGDISHILSMFLALPKNFAIYSGNDELNNIFKHLGGKGCISVASNAFAARVKENYEKGEFSDKLLTLCKLLFCEPNPIPIKYVLSKMGMIENVLRAPLTPLEKEHAKEIDKVLRGLL